MDSEMLYDPHFWVAVAFVLFIALSYKKISGLVIKGLDGRAARIKAELDEARRLREEAEAVLADYKQKQAEYLKEAEAILKSATADADTLRQHAEQELKTALDARVRQAVERIAQEESKAIADVRNHVVDIALAAARQMIMDHVGNLSQEELIKLALADIERKIH